MDKQQTNKRRAYQRAYQRQYRATHPAAIRAARLAQYARALERAGYTVISPEAADEQRANSGETI